jgi:selenide,water dikinase
MDDAVAYDLGDQLLLSTTDFFTPIVDDPYDFGMVAAANAIGDIYAMGGRPIFALGILGWPVEKLPADLASEVIKGARDLCASINIPLAGGHSIDSPEPIFGLAVNGLCPKDQLKTNGGAELGDVLILTKPLGTGVLSTATKRGAASKEHQEILLKQLIQVNSIGGQLGKQQVVHSMTDVTGFGLLGHAIEMAKASGLSIELDYSSIPLMNEAGFSDYLNQFMIPDNTFRNFNAYKDDVNSLSGEQLQVLCDPQTNGGLLISVDPSGIQEIEDLFASEGINHWKIGKVVERKDKIIQVN